MTRAPVGKLFTAAISVLSLERKPADEVRQIQTKPLEKSLWQMGCRNRHIRPERALYLCLNEGFTLFQLRYHIMP